MGASNPKLWDMFRRMLLGTAVEALLTERLTVDFSSLEISFDPESEFRVPRLNNYMRFKGRLVAKLASEPKDGAGLRLQRILEQAWPSLLEVLDIPIGDRLGLERNQMVVELSGGRLAVTFDLIAD